LFVEDLKLKDHWKKFLFGRNLESEEDFVVEGQNFFWEENVAIVVVLGVDSIFCHGCFYT
jgi:hypothetical protein